MKVTIVLAVYNGVDVIEAAVQSVVQQSYTDWHLSIVDDASTDGTLPLLEAMAEQDARVSIIRNNVNRGLAASLNLGWARADSDLIARMDADDLSLPERLEHQVRFMESHPEVAVLGTGAELIDTRGQVQGLAYRPEQHDVLVQKIYKENPFFHPSVIMRRQFLEAMGGYDEQLRRSQDIDLWLRGCRHFRFHNLQKVLIRYRVRRTPSLHAIFFGARVLAINAYREDRLSTHGWYALRYLLGSLLIKAGIYNRAHL